MNVRTFSHQPFKNGDLSLLAISEEVKNLPVICGRGHQPLVLHQLEDHGRRICNSLQNIMGAEMKS